MKANIYDVAKKSGLSVVTVSRVLNNAPTVREKNREKVQKAMKELNYLPHSAARSLALGRTGVIGLILATLQDSVFEGIVKEVNDQLEERGYFLALSIDDYRKRVREGGNHYLFQRDRVDGVILLSTMLEDAYVRELKAKRIPFVLIDNHNLESEAPMIQVDNYAGGYLAANHLLDLGHRRIGHIYGPERLLSARERRQGFDQALADRGLKTVAEARGGFTISEGYRAAKEWIAAGVQLTAVFAADDFIALGAMQAYQDAGCRIPQDVSIIGYDDQDFAGQIHPSLTTVKQPTDELGKQAVRRLISIVDGEAENMKELVKLKPKLLVRQSTSTCLQNGIGGARS